jgi:DNA-binding transcriptional ArsR family regulator
MPMARDAVQVRFLTNHAFVVLAIDAWPNLTVRQIAERVGITERATYAVLRDLERAGYVSRRRSGTRLTIVPHLDHPLLHPMLRGRTLHDLTGLLPSRTGN